MTWQADQVVDPERHLRLLLEDALVADEAAVTFAAAMRAVVGAQILDPAPAAALASDAALAMILRGRRPPPGIRPLPPGDLRAADEVVARRRGEAVAAERHGQPPADRYLWDLIAVRLARLLIDGAADRALDAQPAVDALVACGAITADHPVVAQALLTDAVAVGLGDEADLTARIRTVLDARDHLGREGSWVPAGPAVVIDGTVVAVDRVSSDGTQLWLDGVTDVRRWSVPVAVTATDDRGGWYVGVGADVADDGTARWLLVPSLDPEATALVVSACGPTEVATWPTELG